MIRFPSRSVSALAFLSAVLFFLTAAHPQPSAAQQSCSFNGKLQMNPETLVGSAPVQGNPAAKLLLVEFFDPNCPHCQRFHPVMKQVLKQYGNQIRFYMQPLPLWQFSRAQIRAMLLAKEKGKYYEMIEAQLTSPNAGKGGMTVDQLVTLAEKIGIDPSWMRERLTSNAKRAALNRLPYEARKAGVSSTPTLAIGRKIVGNRSASCIGQLIERELAARSKSGAAGGQR